MRYLLPLVAAALVALLVLWPRFQEKLPGAASFESSDAPVPEEDGSTARQAYFQGVDGKDRPFHITAERAFQRRLQRAQQPLRGQERDGELAVPDRAEFGRPGPQRGHPARRSHHLRAVDGVLGTAR